MSRQKLKSKSGGAAGAASAVMRIDDMFRAQTASPVKPPTATESPYFSPEKKNTYTDHDTALTRRRLTKLSKRFRDQSNDLNEAVETGVSVNKDIVNEAVVHTVEAQATSCSTKRKLSLSAETNVKKCKISSQGAACISSIKTHSRTEKKGIMLDFPASEYYKSRPRSEMSPARDSMENAENNESTENNSASFDKEDSLESVSEDSENRIPYYLENFQVILNTVLSDKFYISLFNEADMQNIEKFNNLTESSQQLYIRLFQRRYRWLRKDKISYPKIANDLSGCLQELVNQELLHDESTMSDLKEILAALPAAELRQLGKSLKLNTSLQMCDLIQAILKHSCQTNISSFFSKSASSGTASVIAKRAKALLGPCYKLTESRDVFIRVVMLFSLHQIDGDMDEAAGGQTQLYQMLMTNIGQMIYPKYTVNKQTQIFKSRQDVIRFQKAVITEDDIFEAVDRHQYDKAMEIYKRAYPLWKDIWKNKKMISHDKRLPEHLRLFTAGAVYARVLTYGVEVLQKQKMYREAVTLLEELVQQITYQPSYHGRWYDRLALNLDQHLKQHSKALDVIKTALCDEYVRYGHRYALFQRAQRICNSPSKKSLKNRWKEFQDDPLIAVMEAPKVTIEGRLLTKNTQFAVYITDEDQGENEEKTLTKRVEDVALAHYRGNGYPEGLHGEGSTFTFLLVLFMWEVIYDIDVEDTFLNPYQTFPLDLRTDHFYAVRREAIEDRLTLIRQASIQDLCNMLAESWKAHEGVLAVNWERFKSLEHAQGLVSCMGGAHLAAIIERMIKNMRYTTGGVPDLVVWNPDTLKFRVVEVKGPGDRLSVKQILWLDYLVCVGIQAETCYVRAVGSKKIQTS